METQIARPKASDIDEEDVHQSLEKILASKHFVNAHKKKKFLRMICDFYLQGRAHELNEYILGYDVFGRDNSYNPSADPIVRVFAHEIRKKLEIYYRSEGANDPIHLEIPAGSYQPVFTRYLPESVTTPPEDSVQEESKASIETVRQYRSPIVIGLGIAAAFLAIISVTLAVYYWQLRQQVNVSADAADYREYGEVWSAFLNGNNPPLVILSNPPVLRVVNPSDPEPLTKDSITLTPESVKALEGKFVTNPEVSIKESDNPTGDRSESAKDKTVIDRNQSLRLILSTNAYTGLGEAIGLHYLTDFFRKSNRSILLKQSRTLSAEDLKNHNVILLGGMWVNEWSNKLTRTEDFVFTGRATIENRNPQSGEESEYVPQFDRQTGNLITDYALITVKPNISNANQVMMLAGIYSQGTEAAAEYVTNKNYLNSLIQRVRQLNTSGESAPYFQVLLKVGVENGIPTTISVLALHELQASRN
jgi:hypothetical protein